MSFSKGTQILTIDGWMKIEDLAPGEKLWGGGGINKVKHIHRIMESPLLLTGEGIKLKCTSLQTLGIGKGLSIVAKEAIGEELSFIQMGEEQKPIFRSIKKTKGILACYDIIIEGDYYVRVGEETGVLIYNS